MLMDTTLLLLFRTRRWWRLPLRLLPPAVQSELTFGTFAGMVQDAFGQERPACDLWRGKGALVLTTRDPAALRLHPSLEALGKRFPGLSLVVDELQAGWWQALAPSLGVIGIPSLDLRGSQARQRLATALSGARVDWCWNLRADHDPTSMALCRLLGSSWRIGHPGQPATNLTVQTGGPAKAWSEASILSLAQTFGWDLAPSPGKTPGKDIALLLPDIAPKRRAPWIELARTLQSRHAAQVFLRG